ncbi:hypothetical protein C8R44DRAFT_989619 [Mycena epipterygia]|nr:hypothetical protein C8R44DRAFT_989619 [Mycena epipterygia]
MSVFLRSLLRLETLKIDTPDVEALEYIGRLPTLETLTIASLPNSLPFVTQLLRFVPTDQTQYAITSPLRFDLDDVIIGNLARARPRIQIIRLQPSYKHTQPQITPKALHSLARYCPFLERLDMPFDACSIPEPQIGGTRVVHECLNELAVGYSLISRSLPVARFLSGIFLCLSSITTDREYNDNESTEELAEHGVEITFHWLWKEVEDQVPGFVAAREEERV